MATLFLKTAPLLENVDAILIDKDGTLIDAHFYWAAMIRLRAKRMVDTWFPDHPQNNKIESLLIDGLGLDQATDRLRPEGPVGVKHRSAVIDSVRAILNAYDSSISQASVEGVFLAVDQSTEADMASLLMMLPGAKEFLISANEYDVRLFVVTTDLTGRARKTLQALSIDHLFTAVFGGDSVENTKPAPDLALKALSQGGAMPENTVVIGDHPVDIAMGRSAGIGTNIGVLTGLSSRSIFEKLDCSIAQDFRDLSIHP